MSGRAIEHGGAALPTIFVAGILFLFLVIFAQFAVWQYGRGVLRSAVLEAARAQTPVDAPFGACERRFESVRLSLLAGSLGDGVGPVSCTVTDEQIVVTIDATFERWLPISPDWQSTVEAVAVRERVPR